MASPSHSGAAWVTVITKEFGQGKVEIDEKSGAILQFLDPGNLDRRYLLNQELFSQHSPAEHTWGSGYLITDNGAGRWNVYTPTSNEADGVTWKYSPLRQISARITREYSSTLNESYTFTNNSDQPITITSLGIQTPFADVYNGAARALAEAVHTHIFCGGPWAWVLAQPMSAEGLILGLRVRKGDLWAYSVESRNAFSSSNNRGHLILHATDFARNPSAFGGQPKILLHPGESYQLGWQIAWFNSIPEFLEATTPPAIFSSYSALVQGGSIVVQSGDTAVTSPSPQVNIEKSGDKYIVTGTTHGLYSIEIGRARTQVQFHVSLPEAVRLRTDYIMRYQRATDRPGLLSYGFLPVDTVTLLTQSTNGWPDWTDGSERIAMPVMLQLGAMRGWISADLVDEALQGWAQFARTYLLDESCTPSRGSQIALDGPRLYDLPWLSEFYHDRYLWKGELADLEFASKIIERAFELGMANFLAIHFSEVCVRVVRSLEAVGQADRGTKLADLLIQSAQEFAARGKGLPGHEVSYEQSIVAPLASLLIDAYTLSKDDAFLDPIKESVKWLLAFSGPQPHARLFGIAIRHWDGYWFGQNRQWGDIFPHYWSALTAAVLLRLPKFLRTPETDFLAHEILKANMLNYNADGSATCAFVMPSSVDGRPGHVADPLANDQDRHLVIWMRLVDEGLLEE
ncbi:hypothetical protein GQ53DRAFT_850579 [Thozetella sp. PMI_491]|nr:hypothetical protein GQ53DRAFT_850579 [Thozetella sp. PMI_491]